MYKIGLVFPRGSGLWDRNPEGRNHDHQNWLRTMAMRFFSMSGSIFYPHLGLLTVAALTPDDFEVHYLNDYADEVDCRTDFDLIGITGMTHHAPRMYDLADRFRRQGIRVVLGGVHATVLPEEAQQHAHSVIVGEAESCWPRLLADFRRARLQARYQAPDGDFCDLTQLPAPRYDLLDAGKYVVYPVQTTRGCPYKCDFCSAPKMFGAVYRCKTVPQVLREIKAIMAVAQQKPPFIFFVDDNLFARKSFAKEILHALLPLKLHWWSQCDITIAQDEELLGLMRDSGCKLVAIGFENIREQNLQELSAWKRKQLQNYPAYIRKIKSYGIEIVGQFIVGMDHDDPDYFQELEAFIQENDIWFFPHILTSHLSTRLRTRLQNDGRLLARDWSYYNNARVAFVPRNMTAEQLQAGFDHLIYDIWPRVTFKILKRNEALRAIITLGRRPS